MVEGETWDEMIVVGRIARTHGNRGEVIVNLETDFPEERFQPGRILYWRRDGRVEAVEIRHARFQQGRPVLQLAGVSSMSEAETLANLELKVPADAAVPLPAGSFYRYQLIGCRVETIGGASIGSVRAVEGTLGTSRLIVDSPAGEVQVPLAAEICIEIDVSGRRIVIDPPPGLLDVNRTASASRRPEGRNTPGGSR